MKTHYIIFLLLVAVGFTACEQADYNLSQSVFIEDPDAPGLPVYSEWGYNTFGAYIDRQVFASSGDLLPAKIIVHPDTFNLYLKGYMSSNYSPVTLRFVFLHFEPQNFQDLIALNDSTFDLTSSACEVYMSNSYSDEKLTVIDGDISFIRVQNLYVDKELTKSILSGEFSLKILSGGEPMSISNGRFDLGIGDDNFYYY